MIKWKKIVDFVWHVVKIQESNCKCHLQEKLIRIWSNIYIYVALNTLKIKLKIKSMSITWKIKLKKCLRGRKLGNRGLILLMNTWRMFLHKMILKTEIRALKILKKMYKMLILKRNLSFWKVSIENLEKLKKEIVS
jgi:hypothetical protein